MGDVGIFSILFDRDFVITAIAAVLAFATIVTLGLPLLARNQLAYAPRR
jgi:hypothetical protein